MPSLHDELRFSRGPAMKNRFMLAPLTNQQSREDGVLSDDEYGFLTKRAEGGFGLVMTCASHVDAIGKGFSGQLGCFGPEHEPGLTRLATGIREGGSLAVVQLHHAGMRSPQELIGEAPVCPSDNAKTGGRALTNAEVHELIESFIAAGERAERCGFDGVELHGAHGYILAQFLSPTINQRTDEFGGSLENRSRPILDIIDGLRSRCRPDFNIGLRISPERFGVTLEESLSLAKTVLAKGQLDYLDVSIWDVAKEPHEEAHRGRPLRAYFGELERGETRMGLAGKIYSAQVAQMILDEGFDYVTLGRAAILHHDFPKRHQDNTSFVMRALPVTADELRTEGLGEAFVDYMRNWDGFVVPEEVAPEKA